MYRAYIYALSLARAEHLPTLQQAKGYDAGRVLAASDRARFSHRESLMLKCRSCLLVAVALVSAGCASNPPPPAVEVSDSNYQEPGAPAPEPSSPHSPKAPPAAPSAEADLEGKWWTNDPPCPEGTNLWGGPPPDNKEVGCKTEKGVNVGKYTRFYDSGKKAEEGQYEKHVAIGIWTEWNESGVRVVETRFDKGKQHGVETEWYPSGKIKSQRTYAGGVREGLTTIWDEDGNKRSAIEYQGGKQHGPATYWDETGKVARIERWANDEKVE
jgi:hypothetical protein